MTGDTQVTGGEAAMSWSPPEDLGTVFVCQG